MSEAGKFMIFYLVVFGILAVFGLLVAWALGWAANTGQFDDLSGDARSIFDRDEPASGLADRPGDSSAQVPHDWKPSEPLGNRAGEDRR